METAKERRKANRPAGSVPRVEGQLHEAWQAVYAFQKERIETAYADFGEHDDLKQFFFTQGYIEPSNRPRFEKRDITFVRIARSWLLRSITSKQLRDYLETVILLREQTDDFDIALAIHLEKTGGLKSGEPLDAEAYREAYVFVTTKEKRLAQLASVLRALDLCRRVVTELPFDLEDILRLTPKAFVQNVELLTMCIEAWRVFSKHKARLLEYERVIRERETDYINEMFANGIAKEHQ